MSSSLLQGIYPQGRGKQKIHELGSELSIRKELFSHVSGESEGVVVRGKQSHKDPLKASPRPAATTACVRVVKSGFSNKVDDTSILNGSIGSTRSILCSTVVCQDVNLHSSRLVEH
jgi:hypothetical protein